MGDAELHLPGSGGKRSGKNATALQTAEVLVKCQLTSFLPPVVASLSIQSSIFKAVEHHEE